MNLEEIRFLVVEDHPFQRWLMANQLREMGAATVLAAVDGHSALEIISAPDSDIDVVISDLDMPGMDGMELIRNISERDRAISLIVVSVAERALISAVETMARAYGVTVLGSIQKPLTPKKLQPLLEARGLAPAAHESRQVAFPPHEAASALRNGQLETHFQPKVDVRTGEVRGAEALVRWRHPDKGLIHPAYFIGAIEEGGLTDALLAAVVGEAMTACKEWHRSGHEISVAVNLSVKSLEDITLADRLLSLVQAAQFDPRKLVLEVTESAATQDVGKELEILSRLRLRGFGLSIDDYGTGYSSMKRLARVPFTELKIDRAFVKRALTQPSSRAMVESSLELASKLGIPAVAEGVETREEWSMLLELGCALAQGYFIAPAMTPVDFMDWMKIRHRGSA